MDHDIECRIDTCREIINLDILKEDGFMIIDNSEGVFNSIDNIEKSKQLINLFKKNNFLKIDFCGFVPSNYVKAVTTIMFRANSFVLNPNLIDRGICYHKYS